MKKILYLLIVVLTACGVQKNKEGMYSTGYNYILSLPEYKESGVLISPNIANIEISSFFSELSKGNELNTLLELDSIDNNREFVSKTITNIEKLPSNNKSKNVMFFSEVIDGNKLLVEILVRKEKEEIDYKSLTMFNNSIIFLFIYDNNNNISNVYKKEIQHD